MSRLSVFYPAQNERGYIQAVIHENDTRAFIALGFVLSVDELQEQEQEQEQEQPPRKGRPPRQSGNSEE
ncbi:TPA: hypothetical protein ACNIQM_002098 [Citrobacter werkmanii]